MKLHSYLTDIVFNTTLLFRVKKSTGIQNSHFLNGQNLELHFII